jgi:thiol-disulfide isomerase/thioredoxin
MIASGPAAKRPPHIVLDPGLVMSCRLLQGEKSVFRRLLAVVLYLALPLGANAEDLDDLLTGEMRGLVIHDTPVAASDLPFERADGTEGSLGDYAGRMVVLNFWATWCAPCREEMPSLQNLHDTLGGDDFGVVTLATGFNQPQAIRRFFDETGVTDLPQYRDINQQIAREMGVFGLPITVILDAQGREIARLRGDAHWDSPEAISVIEALLRGS